MAILTTGPIERDQFGGDIQSIQVQAFNNTPNRVEVVLRVYDTSNFPPAEIGTTTNTLDPFDRDGLTVSTNNAENVLVQIEHPLARNEVYVTVYGRNSNFENLPGATYRHTELIEGGIGIVS